MYLGIYPASPVGEAFLKIQFVAGSWGDIRKKLEKLDSWREQGLQELLKEAQKVYVQRDEEKQKEKARMFVAAVRETTNGGFPGKMLKCYHYEQRGHLKKDWRR